MGPVTTTRRTQAQRRATTRHALLEAAADCLVEQGLAGLSVAAIAERAGLSTGAVFHHFADKAALVSALAEHISEQLDARVAATTPATGDVAARIEAAVRATAAIYEDPRLLASFDLFTAARTDPELAADLAVIDARTAERHLTMMRQLLAGVADHVDLEQLQGLVEVIVFALQGHALSRLVRDDAGRAARLNALVARVAAELASEAASASTLGE